jgi:1,2-phenylacetyl-CoA epoxidase catalytic subunit
VKDDPRYLPTVDRLLRGQAHRERGAAELFEATLPLAPDATARRRLQGHVAEERAHYARVVAVWSEAFARPAAELDAWVTLRLKERPLPTVTTWLELAMAQLLFDRAGRFQISEYVDSSFAPYRALAREIVDDERGHEDAGAALVLSLLARPDASDRTVARATADRAAAQAAFERWLPVALLSFGRPGGDGNAFARAAGLKRRDSAEVARAFLADLAPTLAAAGLALPTTASF